MDWLYLFKLAQVFFTGSVIIYVMYKLYHLADENEKK